MGLALKSRSIWPVSSTELKLQTRDLLYDHEVSLAGHNRDVYIGERANLGAPGTRCIDDIIRLDCTIICLYRLDLVAAVDR